MHIETQISKLDSDLIFHMKTLRILDCNLQLLNQIKACPQVYVNMVVEAARRKIFSKKFTQVGVVLNSNVTRRGVGSADHTDTIQVGDLST